MKTWSCPAGTFQGAETAACYQLRGIRYAISERFCRPKPYCYGEGVHLCLEKAPYAVQLPSKTEEYLFGVNYARVKQEESCQYLSLTIPRDGQNTEKLPVMVWLHGGAFRNGGCDHDCYDSDLLASEGGVIVARVNYRLGLLGYVKDQNGAPANLGLLDVIEALRWLRENIEAFGGDKKRITLFGQSAGAQTIAALLVADGTDELFRSAILQSTPLGAMTGRQTMDQAILRELNQLPVDSSVEELRRAQGVILGHVSEKGAPKFMPFAPHYGVDPLPAEEQVEERLRERAPRHAILIGCNAREASAYIGNNRVIAALDRFPLTRWVVEGVIRKKGNDIFAAPSRAFAARYAKLGGQCWYYDFSWGQNRSGAQSANRSVIGACHCMELVLLFGGKGLEDREIMMGRTEREVCELGKPLREIWTEFAKSGQVKRSAVEGMIAIVKQ